MRLRSFWLVLAFWFGPTGSINPVLAETRTAQSASSLGTSGGSAESTAGIFNCAGTWQNKPCTGEASASLPSAPTRSQTQEAQSRSKRRLWLHDLDMLRIKAKRDFGIDLNPRDAEEICKSDNYSDLECQQIISAKETELTNLIQQAEHLAVEKDKNRIEEEKLKAEQEPTTVNVVNDNRSVIFVRPQLPKSPHGDLRDHPREFPADFPGDHHGNHPRDNWGIGSSADSSAPPIADVIPTPNPPGQMGISIGR